MSVLTCPVCQGQMREMNKDGVLIDICTQCRGVWLDRGELEKLAAFVQPMEQYRPPRDAPPLSREGYAPRDAHPPRDAHISYDDDYRARRRDHDDDDDDHRYRDQRGGHHQKSKMSRFLDFFD